MVYAVLPGKAVAPFNKRFVFPLLETKFGLKRAHTNPLILLIEQSVLPLKVAWRFTAVLMARKPMFPNAPPLITLPS